MSRQVTVIPAIKRIEIKNPIIAKEGWLHMPGCRRTMKNSLQAMRRKWIIIPDT